MARLQQTDPETIPLSETEDTEVTELESRLRSLEVTNEMPSQAEVYGQRTPPDPLGVEYPSISYNAPVLKRFSGKTGEYQTINDFIEAIERQARLQYRNDDAGMVKFSLSLFRTNLKGPARSYLNMLTTAEKDEWEKVKEMFVYKFKTEKDLRAKQRAKEQCASFKQKPEENLKAYGERAMRLRQLIDASEEGFLVYRFLKGIRDKSVRQILAVGPEDMGKITVAQMNARIASLVRVGEESDAEDTDSENSSDESSDDSDSDDSSRHKKKKAAKKKEKANKKSMKKAMKAIGSLEEKLKKLESGGQADTFAAQATYSPNGANYRKNTTGENTRAGQGQQFAGGGQRNDLPDGYLCYNCGNPGHLYRFCPEPKANQNNGGRVNNQQNRQGWGQRGRAIIFPGENGPQSMVWVENPPNGLAPGYFPVDVNADRRERATDESAARNNRKQPTADPRDSGRITELNNTASVDLVSSAARKMTIGTDVIKYVNAVEEAYAGGRRRRAEGDAGSSDAPARARIRVAGPSGLAGERMQASSPPAVPAAAPPEGAERPPQVLRDSDEDDQEAEPEVVEKVVRKRRAAIPKPPRHIRMMVERPGFDVVAEFRDLPVANMKWGTLMDIAPALRRQVGTGLLLERQVRRAKGKGKAGAGDAELVDILGVNRASKPKWKEPCTNFYTTATLTVNRKQFKIEKVMIDTGSVVNLASIEVLEKIGVALFPVYNLTIRTATSALTEIQYYSDVEIEVSGVRTLIRVYAIPREFSLAYGMLLSRRWLQKVRAQGNYERDTYVIADEQGRFREVQRYRERESHTTEIPTIGRKDSGSSDDNADLEEEVIEELGIAESSDGEDEDILRDVIGQATEEMWRNDGMDSAGEADSESSGKGGGR